MKIYTVRKSITNADTATDKGDRMSSWTSWLGASREVDRLFIEHGIECFITTEVEYI